MKEQVLNIIKEEITEKVIQISRLPVDNTIPNTKLHFLTAELGAMQQILHRMENDPLVGDVSRLEVIDNDGRSYTNYLNEGQSIFLSLQDDNRTLKIFVESNK
jgi:hypothetical protein